jgi:hypothetical protein
MLLDATREALYSLVVGSSFDGVPSRWVRCSRPNKYVRTRPIRKFIRRKPFATDLFWEAFVFQGHVTILAKDVAYLFPPVG